MKITILGAGTVGAIIAKDLAADPDLSVTVCDVDSSQLTDFKPHNITTRKANLSKQAVVADTVKDADLVVGALPGFLGFRTLQTLIEAGKNVVDVSFMPDDPLPLHDLALKHGVTAVVDMGVAPGMSNFLTGHAVRELSTAEEVIIYVGGLPMERTMPFQYKAPFSPIDVIEEYTRPARYVRNGHIITTPPLADIEHIDFKGIGTLEAFLTDGLRTLIDTLEVPNMIEKTLRYPGHAELITMLRSMGFFEDDLVDAGEVKVRPIDLTSSLLISRWKLEPEDSEFTAMRVMVKGVKDEVKRSYSYELIDFKDEASGNTSMARTTGYPCAITAALVAKGKISKPGILVPEVLGQDPEIYTTVMSELRSRGIVITEEIMDN